MVIESSTQYRNQSMYFFLIVLSIRIKAPVLEKLAIILFCCVFGDKFK